MYQLSNVLLKNNNNKKFQGKKIKAYIHVILTQDAVVLYWRNRWQIIKTHYYKYKEQVLYIGHKTEKSPAFIVIAVIYFTHIFSNAFQIIKNKQLKKTSV